jgi:hypothetical protein
MMLDRSDFVRDKLNGSVSLASVSQAESSVGRHFLSLPDLCLYVVDATLSSGAFDAHEYAQSQHLVANLLELLKIADLSK